MQEVIEFVLGNEGGYTVDTGGPTNFGITQKYLASVGRPWPDMKTYPREEAIKEYEILYEEMPWAKINDIEIRKRAFDCSVNTGPVQAIKILQKACDANDVLVIDGILGPKTLASINESNPTVFLARFKHFRDEYYKGLVKQNPLKYASSLKGWLNRASK